MTDGKAGTETQCLGLAERLGLVPEIKRIALRAPWRWAAPRLRFGLGHCLAPTSDRLDPPFPDLLIASGRASVLPSLWIGRQVGTATLRVQIQGPRLDPARFDLVIAPAHDRLSGNRVLETLGALHRVRPERLAVARSEWAARYEAMPSPRLAVLIGGKGGGFRSDLATMQGLGRDLAGLADCGWGVILTASRRSDPYHLAALRGALGERPGVDFWDGQGPNPYHGMLAWADAIAVTADSTTMISEAMATGRPLHLIPMPGGSAKLKRFHADLIVRGIARPFAPPLADWHYEPVDETGRAAAAVGALLARRGIASEASAAHTP